MLKDHGHAPRPRRQMIDPLATDADLAGIDALQAGNHAQQRRLAAAGWPEEGDELSGVDRQRQLGDDLDGAAGCGHVDGAAGDGHPGGDGGPLGCIERGREVVGEVDQPAGGACGGGVGDRRGTEPLAGPPRGSRPPASTS